MVCTLTVWGPTQSLRGSEHVDAHVLERDEHVTESMCSALMFSSAICCPVQKPTYVVCLSRNVHYAQSAVWKCSRRSSLRVLQVIQATGVRPRSRQWLSATSCEGWGDFRELQKCISPRSQSATSKEIHVTSFIQTP